MLNYGAWFDLTDSDGLSVLDYAIINNNQAVVDFILTNMNQGNSVIDQTQPLSGNTSVHVCVQPLLFGSYENVQILRKLKESGFDLSIRNNDGKSPLDFAL